MRITTSLSRLVALIALLALMLTALPASAMAQGGNSGNRGNSANAHACQQGGWQSWARYESPRVAFANQDECVSYAAQGGAIVGLVSTPMSIAIYEGTTEFNGGLRGTGFTPNSTITIITYDWAGFQVNYRTDVPVQSDGTFDTGTGLYRWCNPYTGGGYTSLTFVVESPVDGTYLQTFDLESYCT